MKRNQPVEIPNLIVRLDHENVDVQRNTGTEPPRSVRYLEDDITGARPLHRSNCIQVSKLEPDSGREPFPDFLD